MPKKLSQQKVFCADLKPTERRNRSQELMLHDSVVESFSLVGRKKRYGTKYRSENPFRAADRDMNFCFLFEIVQTREGISTVFRAISHFADMQNSGRHEESRV
ncbi:MAG: hypothetical protein K2P33_08805 [Acutalibacter sp.]|nr:hypothetical protein [Acutalibacter sp.]